MSSIKQRREPRVDHEMPITIHFGNGAKVYHSKNVAYRGIFLETHSPLQLNKLVKLTVDIDDATIEFLALVARRINTLEAKEAQKSPGMGLALFSIGPENTSRWQEFVSTLYDMDEDARAELQRRQLTKLHLILNSGPQLTATVEQAMQENYIEYYSKTPLNPDDTYLLTISHSADHTIRPQLTVRPEPIEQPPTSKATSLHLYQLYFLDSPETRDALLQTLRIGE